MYLKAGLRLCWGVSLMEFRHLHSGNYRQRSRQTGVTLIELVIIIVITSVAVAGVVGAFSLVTGRSADPLVQSRATALGQLYLDEITARRYDENTPFGGGRVDDVECSPAPNDHDELERFIHVNEFHTGPNNPQPPRLSSDADELYSGYTIEVLVACAGDELDELDRDDDAKRIDVTVEDPRGRHSTFSLYRGNF